MALKSRLGRKILIFMLIAALGMGGVIFGLSFRKMEQLGNVAGTAQTRLGKTAADESSLALLTQEEESLSQLVVLEANSKDQIFKQVSSELSILTGTVESDLKNGTLADVPPHPEDTPDGVLMGRSFLAPGEEDDEEHRLTQQQIAAAEPAVAALFENEELLQAVLIGTEDGAYYRYSDFNSFDADFDPRSRDWYIQAKEQPGKTVWSDAYEDLYGRMVVTCSRTFSDGDGNVTGVVAFDIAIETITENIIYDDSSQSFSFIIDQDGEYVARPSDMPDTFIRDPLKGGASSRYMVICKMMRGESGVDRVSVKQDKEYIAYAPITTTGWSYGIVMPFAQVTAPSDEMTENINALSEDSAEEMRQQIADSRRNYNVICLICALFVCAISFILAEMILRPIRRLTESAKEMGAGNLDTRIEVKGTDEIAELGHTFNKMADDLNVYIEDYAKATAEKERMHSELALAKNIQENMLPSIFPPYPSRHEFDIYASMDPAKEVGGDFYDFFLIDDDHLSLTIADVSGKGVPAALFMMISKIILQIHAKSEVSPAMVLSKVNEQLCDNNRSGMFVTVWFGIYEISTGKLTAANAGHEYPAVYRNGKGFELMKDKHGFVLGGMSGARYKEYTIELEPGDGIFVYTDGVAEATDSKQELFGTERMLGALNGEEFTTCEELLLNVRRNVDAFVGDAEQFDDLTMLSIRRIE